jgi:hypothetical protein
MPEIDVPQAGQLVLCRGRKFVVKEVERGGLAPDLVRRPLAHPEHLVTLASVDDDADSELTQVVWEIEPGARVMPPCDLPDPVGFDEPGRLDAVLDAVRWNAVSSVDERTLQSPFRSGIEIDDYQLDAVARAIAIPRVNLLVADDVGLGKTIEAGLVVQELMLRRRIRRVLIVCPAALQLKWRDEMASKFGLEFRVVDQDLLHALRRERGVTSNPWTHFPRLIVSMRRTSERTAA